MTQHPLIAVLKRDRRYKFEAYEFVREALSYAQNIVQMDGGEPVGTDPDERHLTGQQLCEASRLYAIDQFGLLAKVVLNSWGINDTGDLGEIVYNMINARLMKKSAADHREDFDDVYDFAVAFEKEFEIDLPQEADET
ncbi:Minf_1886 family protein [Planctomycetota bacterium]